MTEPTHVVVAGGGLAGLAAATVLVERGVRVTLVERDTHLGGRLAAWPDGLVDGTAFTMERGFHAFFRQYYNLRALMQRVDPELQCLCPLEDYPVWGPEGTWQSFAGLPRRTPFNVAEVARRAPSLDLRGLSGVSVRHALEMLRFDPDRTYTRWDRRSAAEYLDLLRFPEDARRMLFEVFAHSFFNAEHELSAAELLMQFHFYFVGNPEGLIFDVLRQPFSTALVDPLVQRLQSLGASVRTGERVEWVEASSDPGKPRATVGLAGRGSIEADAVVLALPADALRSVVQSSNLGTPRWRDAVGALRSTRAFAVWRLWLDRPMHAGRAAFVGTAGMGLLDNVSLFDRFEDESAQWARKTGGSVVELHAYALPEDVDEPTVREQLWGGLRALYPESREASVIDERFRIDRDCPAFPPGSHAYRPCVQGPVADVVIAGDHVRLPFPTALMERAVTSGSMAANALLARRGVQGVPLWSVPRYGWLSPAAWRSGRRAR